MLFQGQDRVVGSSALIKVISPLLGPVTVCEIDKFTAKRTSHQNKFQPLGQVGKRAYDIFEGYQLGFEGGKINRALDDVIAALDTAAIAGLANPRFEVVQTVQLYDGTQEVWVYPDTILYDFEENIDSAEAEIKEPFSGYSQLRIPG